MPADLQVLALSQGLSACSPDEASALGHALAELALLPKIPAVPPTNWWGKVRTLWWLYSQPGLSVADSALVEVLRRWDRLPADVRSQAIAMATGRLHAAGARAIQTSSPSERIAVAMAAQDIVTTELATSVVTLLSDKNGRVITAAERALTTLGSAFAFEYGNRGQDDGKGIDRTHLCCEVARAIDAAADDSKAPFAAAMALLDPATLKSGNQLAAWLCDPARDHSKLRAVLRSRNNQMSRLRAWQWLYLTHLAPAASERLQGTAAIADHYPVLDRSHLALRPMRAAAARSSSAPADSLLPAGNALPSIPAAYLGGLALIARHLQPTREYLQGLALQAVACGDVFTKRRVVSISPPQHLIDLAFDSSEYVARSAALRWSAVGVGRLNTANLRTAANLARSPHVSVRNIGRQELAILGAGDGETSLSRLHTRQMHVSDRQGVIAAVRKGFTSTSVLEQMLALSTIRRLGMESEFGPELEQLARGGISAMQSETISPRVLATVLSLLRRNTGSVETLLTASDNPDSRVRANAIESLLQLVPPAVTSNETYGKAIERCEDAAPRVRANAIRGLLLGSGTMLEAKPGRIYEPRAVSSLLLMLHDERPMHRLSGVWAAERILAGGAQAKIGDAWGEISGTLVQLAQGDDQSHVRRRAAAAARRLAAELRVEAAAAITPKGAE